MPTITLLAKAHGNFQLKLVDKFLKSTLKGLQVDSKICGITPRGWVQIAVSGEDEKVALRYLSDEIGFCPARLEDIKKFSTLRSYVIGASESGDKLYVDVGVSSSENIGIAIPLQYLQAQLADGRNVALKKLVELFGLCKNLPLTVKILNVDYEKKHAYAMLSEKEVTRYRNWVESLFDRLIILGSSSYDVRLTLKKTGLNRDVLNTESLGLFEIAAVCKLGTDAEGLVPKIGRRLKYATFVVFNPKRVLEFLNYPVALIF